VFGKKSNGAIAAGLVVTVLLWGGNNASTKYLVAYWEPGFIGCTRLFCGGLVMFAILKWTNWMGNFVPLPPDLSRKIWFGGALGLAAYIEVFNWALHLTTASHVALYLAMSPVWALVADEPPAVTLRSAQRYGAAACALMGVVVLFWPSLRSGNSRWIGEIAGLTASLLWTVFGRQCRALGQELSGAEISAYTMLRGGIWLMPVAAYDILRHGIVWHTSLVLCQCYGFLCGGVLAYAFWNNGLKHWPVSRVFLFNNLIPLTTMACSRIFLKEPITPTFWLAMILVITGVALGQARWEKVLGSRWVPAE